MPAISRRTASALLGIVLAATTTTASAQGLGSSAPLGGYGATSNDATGGMTVTSPMIIPYAGTFEGFMPGRMGGGSTLSLRSRPSTAEGAGRAPLRLAPRSVEMSAMSRGLRHPRAGARGPVGLGNGAGLGGMRRMPRAVGSGVVPPRIGYPFRQPPSPVAPSSQGIGMSM
jgi:hypothetical protein